MEIGAQYMGDPGGPKAFAVRAEGAGFDSVWCGDHVGHIVDGIAALGCFAGATETITIGVNVIVVPYRPAAVIAKALATIALVAPGRVIAGFGVGGEFPGEFTATGADLHARGAATDEALEQIERLWTGVPVTYRGRWVTLEQFQIEPPPEPPPTVWIGGRSDAALRRAVRFGQGYAPYLVSPEQLRRRRERLGELAAEAGRQAGELTVGVLVTMIPGPGIDAAVELGLSSLRLSGLTPESVRAQYLLGDDDSIVARLQEYANAGVDHMILGCLPGDERVVGDFFEACERIVPRARALRRAAAIRHRPPPPSARAWARPGMLAVIALGGMVGATLRLKLAEALPTTPGHFPWATFWTNVSGSLLLGLLLTVLLGRPPARGRVGHYARPFLATGVLGAYTTMSTFLVETALLLDDGHPTTALSYAAASVVVGLALAAAGIVAGRRLLRPAAPGPGAMSTGAWLAFLAAAAVGAPARYVVDGVVQERWGRAFPWGTLVVNISGCLLLGLLTGLVRDHGLSPTARTVLGTGGLGAYTTFSTFSFETVRLAEEGAAGPALGNVAANIGVGLAAAAAGLAVAAIL